MTRDDGSKDAAPRSVAELLAAYGQPDAAGPRRRRRARDEPDPEPRHDHDRQPVALVDTQVGGPLPVFAPDPVVAETDEQSGTDLPRSSPVREWLALAGQLAVGAVGGAALWVAFQWLWHNQPLAALVISVLVTIGLVFGMRALRSADDLQTTALAVVVGLVVTVSPAALVLTGR